VLREIIKGTHSVTKLSVRLNAISNGTKLTDISGGPTGISADFLTAYHELSSGGEKNICNKIYREK
jgi:hypothetical protein